MADSPEVRFKHLRGASGPIDVAADGERQSIDLEPLTTEKGRFSRRSFLSGLGATGLLAGAAPLVQAAPEAAPAAQDAAESGAGTVNLTLRVNGKDYVLRGLDTRATLLDTLRERIHLTGTKKGCDHGQCGACTVLMDNRRVVSCLVLAAAADGADIVTIEGLGSAEGLHPMQQAFIDQDAFQCGYCTPGQIMSAIACVAEGHSRSEAEIREYMSGNLCRCAAYPNIVAAILQARGKMGAG